jgi:hypothetical protein
MMSDSDDERVISVVHDDDSSFEVSPVQEEDDDEYQEEEEERPIRRSTPVARKTPTTARSLPPPKRPAPLTKKPKEEEPSPSSKKIKRSIKRNIHDADGYDIVVPNYLSEAPRPNTGFSLLLQMDDEQLSGGLDWTSAIGGVIGRMELGTSPDHAIVLDLQGQQYQGYLFPGPTACVLSLVTQEEEKDGTGVSSVLRLEHITDEFCNLIRRPKFARVASTSDNYFQYQGDVDVNREAHSSVPANDDSLTDQTLPSPAQKRLRSQVVARGNKKRRRTASKK